MLNEFHVANKFPKLILKVVNIKYELKKEMNRKLFLRPSLECMND